MLAEYFQSKIDEYILNVNITSNSEAFFVDINKPELNFLELYRQFFKRKWEMLQGSFDYRVLNILRVVYQLHCLSHRHPTASTYLTVAVSAGLQLQQQHQNEQ